MHPQPLVTVHGLAFNMLSEQNYKTLLRINHNSWVKEIFAYFWQFFRSRVACKHVLNDLQGKNKTAVRKAAKPADFAGCRE